MIDIQVNQYQTPLTQEFLSQFPDEVLEQFYDIVNNVEFVKWLISPNRPYAKDCPHDEQGRVIVDIAHPHIIENADYFRQPALHFMKHGCYTFLKPNSNPHSEYRKFWAEEIRRIREGYVRESDGEWVTGFCYWFLNYNPMMVNMITEGKKKADRVESFPFFFEGIYWRFHYLQQAREAGKHAIELAKRGAHPYTEKVFTPDGWKLWQDIKVGDKLFGSNGNIVTVIGKPADDLMPYYNITLRDGRVISASDDHLWQVEVHGKKGIQTLTTLQLLEIYKKKRKPSNRVPSGIEYTTKILTNKGVELPAKDTLVDPYTFGLLLGDGCFRHLSCYFTQEDKDLEKERPYIPYNIVKWNSKYSYRIDIPNWRNILKKYGLENKKSEDKFIPDEYKYNSKEVRLNILKGLFDSDGTVHGGVPVINTTSKQLKEDITEIARSLGYEVYILNRKGSYKVNGLKKDCLNYFSISVYAEAEIFNLPRKKAKVHYISPNSLSRKRGSIITGISFAGYSMCKCLTVDAEDECYLIGDFVTTHNCAKSYSLASIMTHNLELGESETSKKRVTTVLTAYQKEYLKDDKDGTLSKFRPALSFIQSNTPFPRLMLKSSPNEMSWQMGYKDEFNRDQGSFNMVLGVSAKDDADKLRGKRGWILFEEMGTFAGLLALYDTTRKSVEDGDYTFAIMYLVGTANEAESDFSSAKKLLQAPDGYNILSVPNVYDRKGQGSPRFGFFYPAYINRLGCCNHDGVSDVIKALFQVLMARYKAKYNSADPKSVLRVIAEDPITPSEAIVKVKAAYFPVQALNERLNEIDSHPNFYDRSLIGTMIFKGGKAEFKPTGDTPIREYGVSNDTQGALEIFELPEKDENGDIFKNRYIIGHDPVDNDDAESKSLSSTFVFDLLTDNIVAEFTGRKPYAEDNFEMVRCLCLFYNAKCMYESNKKGMYAYFKKMNSTHLLADTPEYLRDKEMVKYSAFGSGAKGVNASAAINNYANDLLRNWLLTPKMTLVTDDDGTQSEQSVPTLYSIRSRGLLEELIAFNPEINVDRIRAMGMVMLYRQEKIIAYQGDMTRVVNDYEDKDYAGNDDFFTQNFDEKFNIKDMTLPDRWQ